MLKAVLFYLEKESILNTNLSLIVSLTQNQVDAILIQDDSLASFFEQVFLVPKHCLLITDTIVMATQANALKMTCIGVQQSSIEGFFTGANCVVDSINNLNYDIIVEEYNHYHNLPSTIAITEHLIIRELTTRDMEAMIKLYANKDHVRFLPLPNSLEEEIQKQKAYITQIYNLYRFGLWGVFMKDTNTLIGRCGLQCFELGDITEVELAYLIDEAYSHKGYGYEATSEILRIAKERFCLDSIIARIHKDNLPSIYLAEKLGFHFEKIWNEGPDQIYRIDFNS